MQVDGAFGMTAAIAELLLQSHEDELALLPALPDGWRSGEVRGLRARGGFDVDLKWQDARLARAEITSRIGSICRVRSRTPLRVTSNGRVVSATRPEPEVLEFATTGGARYVLAAER
jgi:alpha-L-fucosidase 2